MATIVRIARTTRSLRINKTTIKTQSLGGTTVDFDDPAVRRDLNITVGQWIVMSAPIDNQEPVPERSTWTIGTENTVPNPHTITVTLQLKDAAGRNISSQRALTGWFCTTSDGTGLITTAPTAVTAVSPAGSFIDGGGDKKGPFVLVTNDTGQVSFTVGDNANLDAFHVAVMFPNNQIKVSGAIDLDAP